MGNRRALLLTWFLRFAAVVLILVSTSLWQQITSGHYASVFLLVAYVGGATGCLTSAALIMKEVTKSQIMAELQRRNKP